MNRMQIDPYAESMDGMDGRPPSEGEQRMMLGDPSFVDRYRRWQMMRRRQEMLMAMRQQGGGLVDMQMPPAAPSNVQPIQWEDTSGGNGGGLLGMFGGGR